MSALQLSINKYPRTRHLEGSNLQIGDEDDRVPYRELSGRYIVVEEKVDGANSAFSFSGDAELLLQSRGHYLIGGGREVHFDAFKSWARYHQDAFFDVIEDRYVVYGEWMHSKHSTFYDRLPHYFLCFCAYDRVLAKWLSTAARRALLGKLPIYHVPVLYAGIAPRRLADLTALIAMSRFKSRQWRDVFKQSVEALNLDWGRAWAQTEDIDLAEGLYIKVEEGDYTVDRMKWVRAGFTQTILSNDTHWLSRPIIPNRFHGGHSLLELGVPATWEAAAPNIGREAFKEQVFSRSGGRCVICGEAAVDAHHILDRRLFPSYDGGYYLENGAALCGEHHIAAEEGRISVEEVRAAAGSRVRILPPGFDPRYRYDKFGKRLGEISAAAEVTS